MEAIHSYLKIVAIPKNISYDKKNVCNVQKDQEAS